MVRAPLIWLGQADPVASMETARLEGPELSSIRKLFLRWREELNLNGQYTTRQIIQCALKSDRPSNERADSELQDLLLRVAGDSGAINGLRLGKWLSGINCRIVDGHQLIAKRDPSLGNRFALVRM
jgi:hypothetical protein